MSTITSTTTAMDGATLAAAYDRHGGAVYGLAHCVTGNTAVAARLTSEVFATLRLVSAAGGVAGLRECVLTDVHRRAVAWTRAHSQFSTSPATLPFHGLADLDDMQRTVVAEAYFGGKTYDAVADMLDITRGEVARLMQQALHRLASVPAFGRALTAQPQTA